MDIESSNGSNESPNIREEMINDDWNNEVFHFEIHRICVDQFILK